VSSWALQPDGQWLRRGGSPPVESQEAFIAMARRQAVKVGSYEETSDSPAAFRRKAKRGRRTG
jgi:hypothetical protein